MAVALAVALAGCGDQAGAHDEGEGSADRPAAPAAPEVSAKRWTTLPRSRLRRTEVSAAASAGKVYVVGGFDARTGLSTAAVERFDPVTGRWSRARSMPRPLNHMSAFAYRDDLYVLGGYAGPGDTSTEAVSSFWRYDSARDRWSAMPSAPTPRAALAVGVVGDRLYAAGGRNDGGVVDALEIFDFRTRRWRRGPALPTAREHVGGTALDGAFYVIAGRVLGQGNLSVVERYRPERGRWERLAPIGNARAGFSALAASGRVVAIGGERVGETVAPVEAFTPATGRWTSLAPMRVPRHGLGGAVDGSTVYALEGGTAPGLEYSRSAEALRIR